LINASAESGWLFAVLTLPLSYLLRERGFGPKPLTNKKGSTMENKNSNTSNSIFVNPTSVRISKDGRYLIIALPGNQVLRKPLNYFRAILNNISASVETGTVAQGERA
jgi:hypothetical protein